MLIFFTGAKDIPPTGYDVVDGPTLSFDHHDPLPKASTCAIELTLPTKYYDDSYSTFKKMMDMAMTCHGGFGLV